MTMSKGGRIKSTLVKWIRGLDGCHAFAIHSDGMFVRKGIPDIVACILGRFIAIEIKSGSDRFSRHQLNEFLAIESAGGGAFEVASFPEGKALVAQLLADYRANDARGGSA